MRIALVEYGAGNLASVRKAFQACGADVAPAWEAAGLADVDGLVIPGVGHFAATAAIDAGRRAAILAFITAGRPVLGICLGQQWLFEGSTEAPELTGLGVFAGRCAHLRELASTAPVASGSPRVKVPHVGWNTVEPVRPSALLAGRGTGDQAYFTHTYAAPVTADTVARTAHGAPFASAVQRGRVCGVQFHPEKSGEVGLAVLRNFLAIAAGRA